MISVATAPAAIVEQVQTDEAARAGHLDAGTLNTHRSRKRGISVVGFCREGFRQPIDACDDMAVYSGGEVARPGLQRLQEPERGDRDVCPRAGSGFIPARELDDAHTLSRRRGIYEAGPAELNDGGVQRLEGDVGRQQHHGAGALLDHDIRRAEDREKDAGREVETESSHRINGGRFVVDGDVDHVVRNDVAAESRDALHLAWKGRQSLERAGCVDRADAHMRECDGRGACVRPIRQGGAASVGDGDL